MHPACPNKKQNHLQNSFLRRAQFWVRKTFSKPASLKTASLVCPSGRHKPQSFIETKTLRFCNLNTKKNGTAWRSFLGPYALLSKRTKEKHFHGPIFGTVWRYQKWDRKIAKSTAKADPCNEQKMTTACSLAPMRRLQCSTTTQATFINPSLLRFFFLAFGRCCSEARSLHEHKQSKRHLYKDQ